MLKSRCLWNPGLTLAALTWAAACGSSPIAPDGQNGRLDGGYTYVGEPLGPPSVTAVSPATGSTGGGATIVISGTGFQTGANVTFGGESGHLGVLKTAYLFEGSLYVTTPPHAAGPAEVVVTNPDGQSTRVANGYTYVLPGTLDFNGEWEGGTGYDWQTPVRFTIRNNVLMSLTCGSATATLSAPLPVISSGQFSVNAGGITMTGRIITDTSATGTINAGACPSDMWIAGRTADTYSVSKLR